MSDDGDKPEGGEEDGQEKKGQVLPFERKRPTGEKKPEGGGEEDGKPSLEIVPPDAKGQIRHKVFQDEDDLGSPITCLGVGEGQKFYILDALGKVECLGADKIKDAQIEALFAGHDGWLREHFPHKKEDQTIGYVSKTVRRWIMRACSLRGLFDPTKERGPGIYKGEGELVIHAGDAVWRDGDWHDSGKTYEGHVYTRTTPVPRPTDDPAGPDVGREIIELLSRWSYRGPPPNDMGAAAKLAPILVLGWICAAAVAGALRWRPHLWVSGENGTGKSTLLSFVEKMLGGRELCLVTSRSTAAGIMQELKSSARPVIADELEHSHEHSMAQAVVELARMASTEGQGDVYRGSPGGKSRSYAVRGMFLFSAINPPPLNEQDAARITFVELAPLLAKPEESRDLRSTIERLAKQSGALRSRMIANFEQIEENFLIAADALAARGFTARYQDQLGTIIAAYAVAIGDGPLTKDEAEELAEALLCAEYSETASDSQAESCLRHLLGCQIETYEGGRKQNVGELIDEAITTKDMDKKRRANTLLAAYGVRVLFPSFNGQYLSDLAEENKALALEPEEPWIAVAHSHTSLDRLFRGTDWSHGLWRRHLGRLQYSVTNRRKNVNFAGTRVRAVCLAAILFANDEAPDALEPVPSELETSKPAEKEEKQ